MTVRLSVKAKLFNCILSSSQPSARIFEPEKGDRLMSPSIACEQKRTPIVSGTHSHPSLVLAAILHSH
jgi:hypothetical protein